MALIFGGDQFRLEYMTVLCLKKLQIIHREICVYNGEFFCFFTRNYHTLYFLFCRSDIQMMMRQQEEQEYFREDACVQALECVENNVALYQK